MAGAFLKDLTSLATDFVQTATDLALNKTDLQELGCIDDTPT
jgi:hypothetical protein